MLASFVLAAALAAAPQSPEHLAAIQVQGNILTPEADIARLAGLELGMAIDAHTLEQARERLRAAHKFESVEVLKRFASIADPSQIVCVIVVDEGAVKIDWDKGTVEKPGGISAAVEKARWLRMMFLPVITFEDGYGFTYGVRAAIPKPLGADSHMSFPATWGGEKRAGVEFEKELKTAVVTRLKSGADIVRRENPFFENDDDRRRVWVRGERDLTRALRVGASAGYQHVSFEGADDHFVQSGVDAVFDNRIDPMLARNAVYGRAAWEHLAFGTAADANRTELEGRGYVGLFGHSVLVLRALREDSDVPLPPYLSPLLGGIANLRGFKAGTEVGDTLVGSSAELRLPLSSPLRIGRFGVSAFMDLATLYDKGQQVTDQHFERGYGGGVWLSATFLRLQLYVAHGVGGSTRVHFGTAVLF